MTNVKTTSDAPRAAPDVFTASAPVLFNLHLTDVASGAFTDLKFSMKFAGDVSSVSSHLRVDPASLGTQYTNITLGNNVYDVTNVSYTPPGPPGSDNSGSIAVSGGRPPGGHPEGPRAFDDGAVGGRPVVPRSVLLAEAPPEGAGHA